MRWRISFRLTVVIVLLAAVVVATMILLFYSAATLTLENNTKSQMQVAADDKATVLEGFFREENAALQSISRQAHLISSLQALQGGTAADQTATRASLEEWLTDETRALGMNGGVYILDAQDADVLAGTGPFPALADLSSQPFFRAALTKSYVQIPSGGEPGPGAIIIGTPILDRTEKSIGVLAYSLDLTEMQAVLGSTARGEQTHDLYLIGENRYFITQPRLGPENGVLEAQDTGLAADLCLGDQERNALTGADYRGVQTVAAYRWLPDYRLCIISKVDRAEVVAPIHPLLRALSLAGAVALAGAIVVAAFLARSVTRPLLALQRGVEDFGRGNFSQRIPAGSGDEVADLARAFNTMADAIVTQDELLRESNRALEEKVAERTGALQASQAELLALFAAMQDVVLVFDRQGRYLRSAPTGNRALLALLRRVEGKTLHEVLPKELADQSLVHIQHALEGKGVTDFEYSLAINDEQMYFSASISALNEEHVIWVVRDVTNRHETQQALARSEALNRAVIENSPVGISIRDRHVKLVYANDAWCRMKGVPDLQHAIKSSLQDQRSPAQILEYLGENAPRVQEIYERGGSIFIAEIASLESAPGGASWVSQYFYGILGDGGQVESVVTLTQDITARKESEQEVAAILEFSAAMRRPISRAETQAAIVDHAAEIFATEAVGVVVRQAGNPNVMIGEGRGAWQDWDRVQSPADRGLVSEILRSGEFVVINDVSVDPRVIATHLGGITALAAAPLVTHDQVLGALVVGSLQALPESKTRLLRAIGEMAASALYRAILFEETERRLQWLLAIRSIDRAILGSVDVRITMNIMLEKAITQLKMDAASILLLRGNRLEYAYGRGFKTPLITRTSLPMGKLQAGKAALENTPIFIGSYDPAEWECELIKEEGFKSYCVVPLVSKGQVQGVLEVYAYRTLQQDPEWMDFVIALAGLAALSLDTATLVDTVQRTNVELSMAYDITLEGWSRSIDMRFDKVPGHTQRVVGLTLQIARALGLREEELVHVRRGAFLHDVGTIMVPEEILLKPGKLSPDEAEILHQYPAYSHEMLRTIDFLRPALDIPYCHHEKWDGSGFPRGLRGTEIPFAARIFSVVEAWDALTHDRPYRKAWTRKKALRYIEAQSGRHYDPQVVRVFLDLINPEH